MSEIGQSCDLYNTVHLSWVHKILLINKYDSQLKQCLLPKKDSIIPDLD